MADLESSPAPSGDEGERKELKWGFSLDMVYIKSLHGVLTAAITVLSLIAFICVEAGRTPLQCDYYFASAYNFFGFVSMSAFLTGLINYLLYIFTFYDKLLFKFVPWNLWWVIWCGVWLVLYFIASIVVVAKNCSQAGNFTGAVFGFIVTVLLGVLAYFSFVTWRSQGGRVPGPQSETGTSPDYSAEKNMEQY